jgi:hypothetical protein
MSKTERIGVSVTEDFINFQAMFLNQLQRDALSHYGLGEGAVPPLGLHFFFEDMNSSKNYRDVCRIC